MNTVTNEERRDIERSFLRTVDAISALVFVDDEVLGNIGVHVAVALGKLKEAKEHLIAAGRLIRQEVG